jgi:two-component system phosphate regulon sensor histidine kinase PhoR
MDDGVIVVDNNEKIILINSAAQKLFNLNGEMMGKYFIEAIRNSEIHAMIKIIPEDEVEIELPNLNIRYLRIKATRVVNYNENLGVMLFIQDITKIRALEQMRTDFVANVSHELKSPLTSIKGFAETLKFVEDKPTREKFLDIINIESERLTRLINDILTLSEIESKDYSFNFEKINVNKFVEEIFYIKEPNAKDKDIKLSYNYENSNIYIYGDGDKFRQMLINLIDNAIKYTNNGGTVKITTRKANDIIDILVEDNGIGIPRDKIPRLFERFYRVDRGRSREMGGTGLGLAIVKHIVHMFCGEIKVESQVGKGSTFTLSFTSGEKLDK